MNTLDFSIVAQSWPYLWSGLLFSLSLTAAAFAIGMVLMYAVKATGTLRVSREGELEGLDQHEHGGPAYPELVGGFSSASMGKVQEPVGASAVSLAK